MQRFIRLLICQGLLTGFLFFSLCACCTPVSAQLIKLFQMDQDWYEEWAPRLFQSGELAEYTSQMPQRLPSADSLPPLPWAYEIDARQFRHHMAKLDGWVWLVASNNKNLGNKCPFLPANISFWMPFFDSLSAAGSLHVRYATTSYRRAEVLKWRRGLDQRSVPDPLLIVSNEAHGSNTEQKLRRFMRQLARGKNIPSLTWNSYFHLLFDPQGNCVLLAADRYDDPLAKTLPKKMEALYPAEIQRQALQLMRQQGFGVSQAR